MNMNMSRPSMLWLYGLIGAFIIGYYVFGDVNDTPVSSDWTTVEQMVEKGEVEKILIVNRDQAQVFLKKEAIAQYRRDTVDERMMTILKRVGYKTAILSGGFTYFGNYLRQRFGFDYVYANELEIVDGRLTGRYAGEIVDGRRKAELLRLLCQFENINIAQSIAVGDGANDLPMLSLAGLGIAFHAKPKVKATAGQSISTIGLDGILYFLGLKDSWIER